MDRTEHKETVSLEERARRGYERARIRRAVIAASPIVVLAAIAARVEHDVVLAVVVGAAMLVTAAFFFWRGRGLARGVLPGIAAGVFPFAAMHAARLYGHACAGVACFTVCIPAAAIGGIVGGLLVGSIARGSKQVLSTWSSAALFAALTGSLACACVGIGGIAGLVVGLAVGSVPLVLRPATARG